MYFISKRSGKVTMTENLRYSVSDFVAIVNQTLDYAYPTVEIEGEVASFKVNQGKFVFFDLKDAESTVNCFMMVFALRVPIEDGMKVVVTATPKLTAWGRFSLTVRTVRPSGEGSLKKSFELLKSKLDIEGLFAPERKRSLPAMPRHVAVISSTGAAGYADFVKIIDARWGGVRIDVAHVQVQGEVAPEQMVRALKYFNQQEELPEVIVLIRGGGSADDLAAFNDEPLVREIAASRVPVLTGIGHEIDTSLADLAADLMASTPSNAAELLVPDRREMLRSVQLRTAGLLPRMQRVIDDERRHVSEQLRGALAVMEDTSDEFVQRLLQTRAVLRSYNPAAVLARGYAVVHGEVAPGKRITIETDKAYIDAEVDDVKTK